MKLQSLLLWICLTLISVTANPYQAAENNTASDSKQTEATATDRKTNNNWGILGMNVRGNKESPMSLNIVPWRSADHQQLSPEVRPGWQPELRLLQPSAYRREVRAFLKVRSQKTP